jgi:hypothetical protein
VLGVSLGAGFGVGGDGEGLGSGEEGPADCSGSFGQCLISGFTDGMLGRRCSSILEAVL